MDSEKSLIKYPQTTSRQMMTGQGGIVVKKPSLLGLKTIPNPETIPVIILESINSTFTTKKVDLYSPVKIGRKVKAGPASSNGVFDSKVLSRSHAEIYYEGGKVWLTDQKSSNGTFLNGERLR
jgi:pSer/pThr/pTyr-binding forkhead associated (FHA) protein